MTGADYDAVRTWIATPMVSIMLVLLTLAVFHHAQLGLQVIIEDYVHSEAIKITSLILTKFAVVLIGVCAIFAVIRMTFGS